MNGKHLFRILEFNTVTTTSLTSLVLPSTLELVVAESLAAASPHQGSSQGLFFSAVFVIFCVMFCWMQPKLMQLKEQFLASDPWSLGVAAWQGWLVFICMGYSLTLKSSAIVIKKQPQISAPISEVESIHHLSLVPLDHWIQWGLDMPHIPVSKSLWQVTSSDTRIQCKSVKDHLSADLRNMW